MSELLCMARLKIHHGKLDEFKNLAARCVELVRTKDTGTLQYECGTPSPELIEQLKDSPVQVYKPFQANREDVVVGCSCAACLKQFIQGVRIFRDLEFKRKLRTLFPISVAATGMSLFLNLTPVNSNAHR